MSPFVWRAVLVVSVLAALFVVTTVSLTLVLVSEVKDNDVNYTILNYVEVATWIMVGLIGLTLLGMIFTTPFFVAYTRRSESIVSTGLKSAQLSRSTQ